MLLMKKNKEQLLQEQNELIKEFIIAFEDIKEGRIKPFK